MEHSKPFQLSEKAQVDFFQKPTTKIVREILSRPDVSLYIPTIEAQELFFLVKEIGFRDSLELLQYCSGEQIQLFLDFDCWTGDQIHLEKMLNWFGILLELGFDRFGEFIEVLDDELLVSFFTKYIQVYDLSIEEPPEEPVGHFYLSPDRFYVVDILPIEEGAFIEQILDALYKKDLKLGFRILMNIKWNTGAETEEAAYQFHSGRMADLGYFDSYEALQIYQSLEFESISIKEDSSSRFVDLYPDITKQVFLPKEWYEEFRKSIFLNQIIELLPIQEKKTVVHFLIVLMNRALSAEHISMGQLELSGPIVASTLGYLSLGLEYLCSKSMPTINSTSTTLKNLESTPQNFLLETGVEVLRKITLQQIFQVGYGLVVRLSKLCVILREKGIITIDPKQDEASLLESPYNEVIRLLSTKKRNIFYCCGLDDPRQTKNRPFQTIQDVYRTTAVLEKLGLWSQFLSVGLGLQNQILRKNIIDAYQNLADIRLSHILGTLICNFLLERPIAFVLLTIEDITRLKEKWPQESLSIDKNESFYKKLSEQIFNHVRERSFMGEEAQLLCSQSVQDFLTHTYYEIDRSLHVIPIGTITTEIISMISGFIVRRS